MFLHITIADVINNVLFITVLRSGAKKNDVRQEPFHIFARCCPNYPSQ